MLFLNLKNKFTGQRITSEFLSIYRDAELKQSSAQKDNRKDWTCSANSTFILQWNWEAKCCRVIVEDSLSKIGIWTCGFILFYFQKKFIWAEQCIRIFIFLSFFFFSGKAYALLWDREWREKIFLKEKSFLNNASSELKN